MAEKTQPPQNACSYHSCEKREKLYTCSYCGKKFCSEHLISKSKIEPLQRKMSDVKERKPDVEAKLGRFGGFNTIHKTVVKGVTRYTLIPPDVGTTVKGVPSQSLKDVVDFLALTYAAALASANRVSFRERLFPSLRKKRDVEQSVADWDRHIRQPMVEQLEIFGVQESRFWSGGHPCPDYQTYLEKKRSETLEDKIAKFEAERNKSKKKK
jgi:hypothetical protein